MINWRDVRSDKALKQFIAEFMTLDPYDQDKIRADMWDMLERQAASDSLREREPSKPQEKTRAKRQRRRRH